MLWVIFIVIILVALVLLFFLKGREVPYSGYTKFMYYLIVALMVVLLITSIVAWYTDTINPEKLKKPPTTSSPQ